MSLLFFIISFGIYAYTAYPAISPYRDSGDFICSAATLGIAHPPGYPVYVLLGKIFSFLIPWGDISYRINLFSGFITAITAVLMYQLIRKLLGNTLVASLSALILIFSSVFWEQAVISEIYSLNAFFFVLLILLLVLSVNSSRRHILLYLFFLVYGLGLGNHQTLLFAAPGFLYFLYKTRSNRENLKGVISGYISFLLLGLTVYLYIPVRSATSPVNNWGDPSTFSNFIKVLSRYDYGVTSLASQYTSNIGENLFPHLSYYIGSLSGDLTFAGLAIAICGLYFTFRKKVYLFLLFLFTGPFFIFISSLSTEPLSKEIIRVSYILPHIIVIIWFAYGLDWIISKAGKKYASFLVIIIFIFSFCMVTLAKFRHINKRESFFAYDYGKNVLRTVEPGSILFVVADTPIFVMEYFQLAELKRRDIKIIIAATSVSTLEWREKQTRERFPELFVNKSAGNLPADVMNIINRMPQNTTWEILSRNLGVTPIYADGIYRDHRGLVLSSGLIYRFINKTDLKYKLAGIKKSQELWDIYTYRGDYSTIRHKDYYIQEIISYYASGHNNAGVFYARSDMFVPALKEFEKSIALNPKNNLAMENLQTLIRK